MRYVIDAPTKAAEAALERFVKSQQSGDCLIVTQYDAIMMVEARLEKIGTALREFKKNGATWDVFRTYLLGKGLAAKHVDEVLGTSEEFFKKIGIVPQK